MKRIVFAFFLVSIGSYSLMAQRINTTINSAWRFHKGDSDASVKNLSAKNWEVVNLPHTWNAEDAFDETPGYYRGVGWYAKDLMVPQEWEDKNVYLKFEGANQKVEVYLNGNLVGDHSGGYTAFSFDISENLSYGEANTITVKVDNAHEENIPPLNADYTFYGGIYRNIRLIVSEPIHFEINNNASDGVFVETPEVNENGATVIIKGGLVNNTPNRKAVIVETLILDKNNIVVAQNCFDVPDGKYALTLCFQENVTTESGNNMYNLTSRDDAAAKSPPKVDFKPINGKATLSGIRIKNLH